MRSQNAFIQPLLALFFILASLHAFAQGVGIGTDSPHPSAILDLTSDSSGILVPRMSAAQRDAIDSLAVGLLVFVTDDSSFYYCAGDTWRRLGQSGAILTDSDDDTKIMVELDPDDDIIRFETAGEEHFRMVGNRLEPVNSGGSVYIGAGAGASNPLDTAAWNVFIGDSTGVRDTSFYNTAVGAFALQNNTGGPGNTALGTQSMMYNESGTGNTAVGALSLLNNKTGFNNVALGLYALYSDTSANNNTAVGVSALNRIMGGTSNTALGRSAMGFSNSGTNNVAIGESAGCFSEGDNNVLIGFRAGYFNEASDRLYIENSLADSSQALIYGEFDNDFLRVNGRLFPKEGITDIDGDTRLQVEETEDEDILRIDLGGTEYFVLDSGRINVRNTGGSVFIGGGAGANDNLTGNRNVATGDSALYSNTSGYANIAVGYGALFSNTAGNDNVATGVHALQSNTTGIYNVATGSRALQNNTTGDNNIASGIHALRLNTTGSENIAIGAYAMQNSTTGSSNLAIGVLCMLSNQTGRFNVATGRSALSFNTTGSFNIASGFTALRNNMTGSHNIAIGDRAGYNSMGDSSIFIGSHAGYHETASNRLYIENSDADSTGALIYGEFDNDLLRVNGTLNINGAYAMPQAEGSVGQVLTADGMGHASWADQAPALIVSDSDNDTKVQVEESADEDILRIDLDGTEYFVLDKGRINVKNTGSSVFLGDGAGANDDLSNNQNAGLGHFALFSNSTGSGNSAVGSGAMSLNTTGSNNTAMGAAALSLNSSGVSNTVVGFQAMYLNSTGNSNNAIGENALRSNTSGRDNTAIGKNALYGNTSGRYNSGLGNLSLRFNQTGYGNTALGHEAGYNALGDSSVFIGVSAGRNETAGHRLYIENSPADATSALIYGEFDNDLLRVNGTLNINGAYDMPLADGTDGQMLRTDGLGNLSWVTQAPAIVITDADNNTKIQVEESANEDLIRFDLGGTEHFIMNGGRLDVRNNGESVFIGQDAGVLDDFTSNKNVYIGFESGKSSVFGGQNAAVGYRALQSNTDGFNNAAFGLNAMLDNTTGHNNTGIGLAALSSVTTGLFNTAVGSQASLNTNGVRNVSVGHRSLFTNTTGSFNVAIGEQAGYSTTGSSSVFIGQAAGYFETQSNRLYIENSNASSTGALIYGEFDNDVLNLNGSVTVKNNAAGGAIFRAAKNSGASQFEVYESGEVYMYSLPSGTGTTLNIDANGRIVRNTSSRKDKTKIQDFETDYARILQVQPRQYERPHNPGQTEIGYIAEEIDSIGLGELVVRADDGTIQGLTYDKFVLYTNEVVKQHELRIAELEALHSSQSAQLTTQQQVLADQQALIDQQSVLIERLMQKLSVTSPSE